MIIDGRLTSGLPETDYDLVIVGSGPSGITLAQELGATGLKIALLEGGGDDYDEATQALNFGRIEGFDSYDLESMRDRWFGGSSNHWGGLCTPLDAIDFDRPPGTGLPGWPFSRAALDPFYVRAHPYCDLGAYNYDFSTLAPTDPDYRLLAEEPELETRVIRQSTPTRFGAKYRNALDENPNVHLWFWTNVVRVETRPGMTPDAYTRTLTGTARRFRSRATILAGGTIQAPRLLLHSNVENGTSVGDAGDLLGKCFMDHPAGGAGYIQFTRPITEMIYWAGMDTYADDGVPLQFINRLTDKALTERGLLNFQMFILPWSDHPKRRRAADLGVRSLKDAVRRMLGMSVSGRQTVREEYCDFVERADAVAIEKTAQMIWGETFPRALLRYEIEELPRRSSYVALDPKTRDALGMPHALLKWDLSMDDLDHVRKIALAYGEFVGKAGIGRVALEDYGDGPYLNATTSGHQLGTMRLSHSPTAGVADADAKVHGTDALYATGEAVFSTAGRANPTLSVVALAIRLADHLKSRMQT